MNISTGYISKKAALDSSVFVVPPVVVFGPTSIGSDSALFSYVFVGFPTRKKLIEILREPDLEKVDGLSSGAKLGSGVIVRSHCVVYEDVELLDGVELGHNVLVREKTVIGKGVKIGTSTIIDGYTVIGDDSNIQSGVYIPIATVIGRRVFIGPRAVITNDKYPPSRKIVETVIEDDAVIGANSTIVAGVRVGRSAVVAAGAVVTRDVESEVVVAGVPARPVMKREEYEEKKRRYEEISR
ncbi:MAG: acyltransferase [Sulfolobales archaeon]|nr:acetyltransferase [Sulfolobales archaeon]MDW8082364.1 acyltransferase [Sulfolobales archaeon]